MMSHEIIFLLQTPLNLATNNVFLYHVVLVYDTNTNYTISNLGMTKIVEVQKNGKIILICK